MLMTVDEKKKTCNMLMTVDWKNARMNIGIVNLCKGEKMSKLKKVAEAPLPGFVQTST